MFKTHIKIFIDYFNNFLYYNYEFFIFVYIQIYKLKINFIIKKNIHIYFFNIYIYI